MKHRFFRIISLALILAVLAPSVAFAMADALEELELDIDESMLLGDVEGDLLPTEGDVLELDDGFGDGLISGNLLDVTPPGEGSEVEDIPQTPERETESKGDEDQTASETEEPTGEGDGGANVGGQAVDVEIEIDEAAGDDAGTAPGEVTDALPEETDGAALALQPNDILTTENVESGEGSLESVTASGGMDNDAMFEAYMRQVLPGMAPRLRLRSAKSAGANLSGLSARLYGALLPMIREVAGGTRTSTVFELDSAAMDTENRWWTAEDLGLASLNESNVGAVLLAKEGFDQTGIMQALLANCPYDLYWFDKTKHENKPSGMSWSYKMTRKTDNGVRYIRLTSMTAKMVVAKDYSRTNEIGTYEVNDLPRRVSDAVTNINRIVADNSGKSDEDKLWAYANAVCGLVEYNYDALKPDTPYGDPWQLVFIFDGDDSTKVVCEGYSKGFKYLCDLSSFRGDVACELMSGSILAGAHMWNTVHMPDGRNYLVDLTNSDGGSSCNGWCYMKGCTGDPTGGYTCNGLEYQYGGKMLDTFGIGWLTLSNGDYGRDYAVNVSATCGTLTADPAVADPGQTVTLTLTPDAGCLPTGLTVDHGENLQKTADFAWTFTMPMREVTAEASCEAFYEITAFSGEYDGQRHSISVNPVGSAQGMTVKYGTAKGACDSDASPAWKDVGTYTVYYRVSVDAIGSVEGEARVAIDPKPVGLSWGANAFTYDGQGHAPTATATGLISGDSCAVTVAGEQTKVGSYTATATKLSNANYALPSANTKAFTIGKRTVGLSWGNTTFTYDGQGHAPTATATGLISGDSCAVTVTGEQTNVGSYTATAAELSNGNYALPPANTRAFTINKRTVGLSWGTSAFTYDGQGHAPTATATGLVAGDSCAVTVTGEQTNVGSYTATASGLSNDNYVLPEDVTQAFVIAPKTVKLKWSKTRVTYNRKAQKPTATASGLIPGDVCAVTVTGEQTNVGNYTATAAGLSNDNYALPEDVTQAFVIAPKTVKLKWSKTRVTYNRKTQKPKATAVGLIPGDTCTVTVKGSGKDAGIYTVRATGLSNSNYALPSARTHVLEIIKKTVKLKWTGTRLKYNGKLQKPVATATGLIKGDKCKVTVTGSKRKRGTYTANAIKLSNKNYKLPKVTKVKFRIY